tara:strand:- start:1982 stop:2746 length:765 start_codon:yes stop_codon:yes gene_type:complete
MFIHNLNPTLLEIGPLEIRYYGIVYALGFLLVYYMLYKKREELKIKREQVDNLILALLIGLLVGARIFHFVFSDPLVFLKNPLELFMIWNGGMSFFGAFTGCFIASVWYLNKIKLDWKKFADVIVIGVTVALIFGRIANFINGELVGTISSLPWCVVFSGFDTLCRHPYQIYASLSHVLLLGILLFFSKFKKKGLVFTSFLIGYSILRFITDFVREDLRFIGLTVWQYVSLVVVLIGLIWLVKEKVYKKKEKEE